MKTLRFLGIAALSVLMGFNLTSCDDDDDDEATVPDGGGQVVPGVHSKHLVSFSENYEVGSPEADSYQTNFYYDEKGHLLKAVDLYADKINYTWEENQVTTSDKYCYFLEDGKFSKMIDYDYNSTWVYNYDKDNQLISCGEDFEEDNYWINLQWENGKFRSFTLDAYDDYPGGKCVLAGGKECAGYNPFFYDMFADGDYLPMIHPEFLGKIIKVMPEKMTESNMSGSVIEYAMKYEQDKEGYIVKIDAVLTFKDANGEVVDTEKDVFEYVWE